MRRQENALAMGSAIMWTSIMPFATGQGLALEIRKFVFSIRGDGRVTALSGETVGIHMHVPPQLGIEEIALDLTLSYRGSEAGNGLRLDFLCRVERGGAPPDIRQSFREGAHKAFRPPIHSPCSCFDHHLRREVREPRAGVEKQEFSDQARVTDRDH